MTRDETIKVLASLKAAYPASYKNMTKDEANGTIGAWQAQFLGMPYSVVSIAITKIISTNTFPPSIAEVKEKIRGKTTSHRIHIQERVGQLQTRQVCEHYRRGGTHHFARFLLGTAGQGGTSHRGYI